MRLLAGLLVSFLVMEFQLPVTGYIGDVDSSIPEKIDVVAEAATNALDILSNIDAISVRIIFTRKPLK